MTKRKKLKYLLETQLIQKHRDFFKYLYSGKDLDKSLDDIIKEMDNKKLTTAIRQAESTIKNKKYYLQEWREEKLNIILNKL